MQDLANRLARMKKHLAKWARRRGITCYRLYDRDIPEYPFIADIYEDHLILTEMASATFAARSDYTLFKEHVTQLFVSTWDIRPENLHLKTRFRRTAGEQYEKLAEGNPVTVHEAGLKFSIYPDNWLDAGLFLDHRNLRARVREEVRDKKFLNLFCYTGSFSVFAAAGGASLVHNIDLSTTYLGIADKNLHANGFADSNALKIENFRRDAREFLQTAPTAFYDIIVCDPPVFSKSRRQERDFDVLRDHPQLIRDALRALKRDGTLFFSTNFRKFRIRFPEAGDKASVKDITRQTIPEDFRNKWIHTSYEIHHSG